jgi:hypothetical protein
MESKNPESNEELPYHKKINHRDHREHREGKRGIYIL